MDDSSTILVDRIGAKARVRLNRPDRRNALSPQMIADLQAALSRLEGDPAVRAVIITGEGAAFSSGMDLEILREIATTRTHDENLTDSKAFADLLLRVHRYPKPVIAAVNGPAVAGGCGLATVCDFTIASELGKFGYTECRIGFVAAIVSVFLLRIVGEKVTRDLLLTARLFDAPEALRMGLVREVVPAEHLLTRAAEIADQIAENSPHSLAATKDILSRIPGDTLEADLARACEMNARVRGNPDCREGITAFLEKRKPHWSHA